MGALSTNPFWAVGIWPLAMANANFAKPLGKGSGKMSDKLEARGLAGALGPRHIQGIEGSTKGLLSKRRPK